MHFCMGSTLFAFSLSHFYSVGFQFIRSSALGIFMPSLVHISISSMFCGFPQITISLHEMLQSENHYFTHFNSVHICEARCLFLAIFKNESESLKEFQLSPVIRQPCVFLSELFFLPGIVILVCFMDSTFSIFPTGNLGSKLVEYKEEMYITSDCGRTWKQVHRVLLFDTASHCELYSQSFLGRILKK